MNADSILSIPATDVNGKKEILVVDDEPSIREVIGRFLDHKGYRAYLAATVDHAIQYISQQKFDLIVSDHKMPVKSGEELYNFIKENMPELLDRFILITGSDIDPATRRFIEQSNVRLLTKPFDLTKFGDVVEEVLKT